MDLAILSKIAIGAGSILVLAAVLDWFFVVKGRIGRITSVLSASVLLAVLAVNGMGLAYLAPELVREASEKLWLPAAMFGSAMLFASVV